MVDAGLDWLAKHVTNLTFIHVTLPIMHVFHPRPSGLLLRAVETVVRRLCDTMYFASEISLLNYN